MSLLVDGGWSGKSQDTKDAGGGFERKPSAFRNWVTADGSPGPSGAGGFRAEAGRYHLYVSLACPWAHRTLIMRTLKGLGECIGVSVVDPHMGEEGWVFGDSPGGTPDALFGARRLHEIYQRADPGYTGRATVPILWDKERATIVSNESSEIIRMLNAAFVSVGASPHDYYPECLRPEIDLWNDKIYATLNNGVYRAGFATRQRDYEQAVYAIFDTLDLLEDHMAERDYVCGGVMTEVDIRLFTTLVRFDAVYVGHFKCNIRRLIDYENLNGLLKRIYALPGVSDTVNFEHIKRHYYESHPKIDPTGIVPVGPTDLFSTNVSGLSIRP